MASGGLEFTGPMSRRSYIKSSRAAARIFRDLGSCLTGNWLRTSCLGSFSGCWPSAAGGSAATRIWTSATILSRRRNSSSGCARMHVVRNWANPMGVRAGTRGREYESSWIRWYWQSRSLKKSAMRSLMSLALELKTSAGVRGNVLARLHVHAHLRLSITTNGEKGGHRGIETPHTRSICTHLRTGKLQSLIGTWNKAHSTSPG